MVRYKSPTLTLALTLALALTLTLTPTQVSYKATGTYVLKVDDELIAQLDDHTVMVQAMNFSPHRQCFEERITRWETMLRLVRAARVSPLARVRVRVRARVGVRVRVRAKVRVRVSPKV